MLASPPGAGTRNSRPLRPSPAGRGAKKGRLPSGRRPADKSLQNYRYWDFTELQLSLLVGTTGSGQNVSPTVMSSTVAMP
jgi:hypothetical protein